jgi:hypothetical protein
MKLALQQDGEAPFAWSTHSARRMSALNHSHRFEGDPPTSAVTSIPDIRAWSELELLVFHSNFDLDLKSACHFKLPSLGCRNCRGKRYAMESVYRVTQRASRERRRMYGLGAHRAQRSGARDFLADGGDLASGRRSIGARSARLLHPRTLEVRPPRGDRMSVCPSDRSSAD